MKWCCCLLLGALSNQFVSNSRAVKRCDGFTNFIYRIRFVVFYSDMKLKWEKRKTKILKIVNVKRDKRVTCTTSNNWKSSSIAARRSSQQVTFFCCFEVTLRTCRRCKVRMEFSAFQNFIFFLMKSNAEIWNEKWNKWNPPDIFKIKNYVWLKKLKMSICPYA